MVRRSVQGSGKVVILVRRTQIVAGCSSSRYWCRCESAVVAVVLQLKGLSRGVSASSCRRG